MSSFTSKRAKKPKKIKHRHKVEKMNFEQLRRLVSLMKEEPNLINIKELAFLKDALPWLVSEWKDWALVGIKDLPESSEEEIDDDDDSDMPDLDGEDDDDMPDLDGEDDDEMPDLDGEDGDDYGEGETKNQVEVSEEESDDSGADSDDEIDDGLVTPDSPPYPPQSNRHRNSCSDVDMEASQQAKMAANDAKGAGNAALAVEKYTESVVLNPSPLTYANRAQQLLKVDPPRPNAAIQDCKSSKRRRSNVAVIIVKVIFISSFLLYCLLLNHSFPTNPNSITNLFKTYSLYIIQYIFFFRYNV